jgi:hypothetical protein
VKRHLALLVVCGGLAIAVAPALAAFRTGAYKGHTGDRHALSFRATQSGLSSFSFGSRFRCGDGTRFVAHAKEGRIRVHRGRFDTTFANSARSLVTEISGTIQGRTASGRISRTARFNRARKLDPSGRLVCTSATTWSATASRQR